MAKAETEKPVSMAGKLRTFNEYCKENTPNEKVFIDPVTATKTVRASLKEQQKASENYRKNAIAAKKFLLQLNRKI